MVKSKEKHNFTLIDNKTGNVIACYKGITYDEYHQKLKDKGINPSEHIPGKGFRYDIKT